jgi:hypothetical protein
VICTDLTAYLQAVLCGLHPYLNSCFCWFRVYVLYYMLLTGLHCAVASSTADLQLKPLDIASARTLQLSTQKTLEQHSANAESSRRRFYSVHETGGQGAHGGQGGGAAGSRKGGVMLEQLVQAEHMDADGQVHLSKKSPLKSDSKKASKKSTLSPLKEAK